ncbi:hypothetical protein B0H11DRAFT_1908585 [Mycena galericulata]|nr:hypothetical protein B0H11DRAFT_1908585 [Mycena galericulata]
MRTPNPPDRLEPELVAGQAPGLWIRDPRLRAKWLDVLCRTPPDYHNGIYNNAVGVIRGVPGHIRDGEKGVVEVALGAATEIVLRKIRVQYIYPLGTTEIPEVVPRALAAPIMQVPGTEVIVVGADVDGDGAYVGEKGNRPSRLEQLLVQYHAYPRRGKRS